MFGSSEKIKNQFYNECKNTTILEIKIDLIILSSVDSISMETQPDEVIENFRLSLKHVIEDIVSHLPDTDEYRLVRGDLNDVKGSIYYTAPEVLTNSANKVHNILKKYLPLNTEDDTKNPKWLKI